MKVEKKLLFIEYIVGFNKKSIFNNFNFMIFDLIILLFVDYKFWLFKIFRLLNDIYNLIKLNFRY